MSARNAGTRRAGWMLLVVLSVSMPGCIGTSGPASLIKVTSYWVGREVLEQRGAIDKEDQQNLNTGNLAAVRDKYAQRPPGELTLEQLRLLCDLQVRANDIAQAQQCLDLLADRVVATCPADQRAPLLDAITGSKALLSFAVRKYRTALELSQDLSSDGGRYILGLALAATGKADEAASIAQRFARYTMEPQKVYFATSIFVALGQYEQALELAMNPRTRLAWDYGLAGHAGVFGEKIKPAVFRLDLFGEYRFGWFAGFSYAPRANAYVEFLVAKSMAETGSLDDARARFELVLEASQANGFYDIYWMTLNELGRLAEQQGNPTAAIDLYLRSIEAIESVRATIASEAGRIGYITDKFVVYDRLVDQYSLVGDVKAALMTVERAKSRALVDLMGSKERFTMSPTEVIAAQELLDETIMADLSVVNPPVQTVENLDQRLRSAHSLGAQLAVRAPHVASLVTVTALRPEELLSQLGKDESCLLYQRFGDTLHAFFIDHQHSRHEVLGTTGIDRLVTQLRESLGEEQGQGYATSARELYDVLIRPFAQDIEGSKLLVVPSGVLYYIPFAALLDGDHALIEDHSLRVLPSLSVLSLVQQPTASTQACSLILGNPDLGDPALDLPGAQLEAEAVSTCVTNPMLLLGRQASAAAFRRTAGECGMIHVAAHGVLDRDNPLDSRLLLAPEAGDDGAITVTDLFDLRLQARLVVLSGCETALGGLSPGDELIGLNRGLLYAGASGIIGSLWQVEDEASALLMRLLYEGLAEGLSVPAALRKAQLEIRQQYPHPFFWSAFTYTGIES